MDIKAFMLVMLVTGTANTLLMKFQVLQLASPAPGAVPVAFDHPFFQTVLMMIGELFCLAVFFAQQSSSQDKQNAFRAMQNIPSWVFLIPCACDWTATTLVNGAYILLPASIVQMTRGAIVIFTCLFSVVFLKRRQERFHYLGVFLVFIGITIVSLAALVDSKDSVESISMSATLFGLSLCIGAQIFQASMIVYEEKIMQGSSYDVQPLQMVGMEGLWGCAIGVVLLLGLNATGLESTSEAVYQMQNSPALTWAILASIASIAFFNWSGITVTQKASATSRSTVDCSRTIIIWIIELALRWHAFSWFQLLGFFALACGTLIYNQILTVPGAYWKVQEELVKEDVEESAPILIGQPQTAQ